MAQGQTGLSIFNVAVCTEQMRVREGGRERESESQGGSEIETNKLFFHALLLSLPPSLMNYQCFEVISMQRPDSKLGSQPLPCRHMS